MRGVLGLGLAIRYIGGRIGAAVNFFIINLLTSTSTRNSTTTGITDGLLVTYAANTPSFNEGALQNYDAWTNYLLQSNDLDLSWVTLGTESHAQDLIGADGVANSGWTIDGLSTNLVDYVAQSVGGLTPSVRYEPSFILKQLSTSGVISIENEGGTAFGRWLIDLSLLSPTSWETVDRDHPAVTVNTEWMSIGGGNAGPVITYLSGTGPLSVGFSGAQLNAGEISYPYGATTTAAETFNADVTTSPTPLFVAQDGDWAFKFKGTPKQTAQALKALFSFDSDATNYTEIQLNAANITANSVLLGVSNGAAVGLYTHTVDVQFETNVYYVVSTKTLGIRSDDVSGDISAVAFVEDVLTSHPVITTTLSIGNRNSLNQPACDIDNDGVPVFFTDKENAGW